MTPLKSQLLGLSLGLATAIGCILYEKIVSNFSYMTFMLIWLLEGVCLFTVGHFVFDNTLKSDISKFLSEPKYWLLAIAYIVSGVTSLIWYKITTEQGVMVGSVYEIKYIIIMALLYILFGDNKFTWNTAMGVVFALISIYFISKK